MVKNKQVLLIGGGGTLGTYTAKELIRCGAIVDIICPEKKSSDCENLRFYQEYATEDVLKSLLAHRRYNGIVNFLHYPDANSYPPIHRLLSQNTEHLIFLSSYRVYADVEHPITENAPLLVDVLDDKEFWEKETYAVSKSKAEQFIRGETGPKNWTIVRPVISFSDRRLDLVNRSGREILTLTAENKVVTLPKQAQNLTAGLDWAGNSGKLIANLLFKDAALAETYTISSAQNLRWGEVAKIYERLLRANIQWIDLEEYVAHDAKLAQDPWILKYDRLFDRSIDNSKVLRATGLRKEDFLSIEEGIRIELAKIRGN